MSGEPRCACRVLLEGIVGEGVELTMAVLEAVRPSEISYHLAKHLLYNQFRDPGEPPKMHLLGQIKRVAKCWLDEGYLVCIGGTTSAMVTSRASLETVGGCRPGLKSDSWATSPR